MKRNKFATVLVLGGAAIQIISLSADFLGIGGDPLAIGWKQLLGAAVGLVVIFAGIWFMKREL